MNNRYKTEGDITTIYCEYKGEPMEVTISTSDLPNIQQIGTWGVNKSKKTYYCKGRLDGEVVQMHRFIVDAPKGKVVDHKDSNGLNNTRDNLKVCTNVENLRNRGANKNTTSGHKGVSLNKNGKWDAKIGINGKVKSLGQYNTIEEAILARKDGEKQYWK